MHKVLVILVIFLNLNHVNCQYDSPEAHGTYLIIFGGVVVAALMQHLARHTFQITIPYSVFVIIVGILLAVGSYYSEWMMSVREMADSNHKGLPKFYLPIMIFSISFCTDFHTFVKSLPQVMIIALPVSLLSACFCGFTMKLIIGPNWSNIDGLTFGILFSAIYPLDVLRVLKELSTHTKHVAMLLTGEMILSTAFTLFAYNLLLYNIGGWVVHWYQFVMAFVRLIFLGIPISYLTGLLGASIMRMAYNEPVSLLILSIAMCYISYDFCKKVANAEVIGVMFTGLMMGIERAALSKDMAKFITDMWKVLATILNGLLFLITGIMIPTVLENHFTFSDYAYVFITYLLANMGRLLSFFIFSPILSRIGYGLSLQNMIICVWGGLKNPIILSLTLTLDKLYESDLVKARTFFMHHVLVYMLFLLINGSLIPILLKALGLSELSIGRQVNMNNCMKYIYQARERTIAILKMDRFLSDANWPLVISKTGLKHPYKNTVQMKFEDDEEDDHFLGYRFAVCPDCKKSFPTEPTSKELKEMNREAKMRVLKLKKIAYSKQYEDGLISKEGIRILHQAVEIAMDTDQAIIELDGLCKMFRKEGYIHRFVKNRIIRLLKSEEDIISNPRQYYRYVCYRIITSTRCKVTMYLIIFLNICFVIYRITQISENETDIFAVSFTIDLFFFLAYLVEFWMKIFAYSWIHICQHGFATYFRSGWNIIDFIVLCSAFVDVIIDMVSIIRELINQDVYEYVTLCLRLLRILGLLKMITIFRKTYGKIIKYFDFKINKHRALAYELGKNYVAGEEEILENLPHIVDNENIRESIKDQIDTDRLIISKLLGIAQKERPWIAVSVKTKLAASAVLESMKYDIKDLKISGWVDEVEYTKLKISLADRYKYVHRMKPIQPPAPRTIFENVPWMGSDQELINFLYNHVNTKKFDPGDVVLAEKTLTEGIYILIAGVFVLSYTAYPPDLKKLTTTGALPVVDYISSSKYNDTTYEYIVPGNSIGELGTLTKRPYNCVITAETYSQVYVLSREVIEAAMSNDSDPINGLECRLWKSVSYSIALPIIMDIPSYRTFTNNRIKYVIERSFVPDISNYKVFVVNEMMEDVILIEGMVEDSSTKKLYTAPCYIPRTVQRLLLPKSSQSNVFCDIETKLLIVPAKDCDEYEMMVDAEKICELVSDKSNKCLQHLIQSRESRSRGHRRPGNKFGEKVGKEKKISFSTIRPKISSRRPSAFKDASNTR
ncbi:sperm-specific sodium:proton exchanger-like isoform X3 [Tenebrio molitor]|uniref:sperm-specific sodium:proton exchanger-like isoform X3 n=1 Tax=Tenebrio molitor TaxID=7067 RepID=UPI0036248536